MKILFFTYDFPYPTNSGGKMRAYNLLKFANKGVDIYLFSFVRSGFDEKHIEKLNEIGIKHVETFPRKKVRSLKNIRAITSRDSIFKVLYFDKAVKQRIVDIVEKENIDILHFESFYTSFYMDPVFAETGIKQIYGSENIEFRLYEDYVKNNVSLLLKPGYKLQTKKIKAEEIAAVNLADATLAVTDAERAFFEDISGKKSFVIENGVALDEFPYHAPKKKDTVTILYVGNFNYFPNLEAIEFFYTKVFTQLPQKNIRLVILGKGSSQFKKYNDARLELVEYIEDITKTYNDADIFVSPVRIGGGTNFKILEAMATGVPVVTFSDRVKDIGAKHDHDVLTADTAEDFIREVARLLDDVSLREKLSQNARKIIEEKFSWEVIGENLHRAWKDIHEAR